MSIEDETGEEALIRWYVSLVCVYSQLHSQLVMWSRDHVITIATMGYG